MMTATALAAVPPVSCAEVRWLGYVHTRRRRPSSLFEGLGDAPVPPLSCSRGQRDTLVPPCVPQYSHHTAPGARERPLYLTELVLGLEDTPVLSLIFPGGPRAAPMPPPLHLHLPLAAAYTIHVATDAAVAPCAARPAEPSPNRYMWRGHRDTNIFTQPPEQTEGEPP